MIKKEPLPGRELDVMVGHAIGMQDPERELWYTPSTDIKQAMIELISFHGPYQLNYSSSDSMMGDYYPEHWTCRLFDEEVEAISEVSLEHAICHAILEAKEKGW